MEENDEELANIRKKITVRNPYAFSDKLKLLNKEEEKSIERIPELTRSERKRRHVKGCNCKKSQCMNNYCECHQLGAKCTELCKCKECQNQES